MSVGGTLFFPILLWWKKRVWGTLSNFHRTEGEKECNTLFLPIYTVGWNSGGYTLSPHLYGGVKQWGVHSFSLDNIALAMVGTQIVKI